MTERPVSSSFIIRIYRMDTKDPGKITGLVETLDGSLERQPFAGLDHLGIVLNRLADKPSKKNRGGTKPHFP